jgi:hypothetical protein
MSKAEVQTSFLFFLGEFEGGFGISIMNYCAIIERQAIMFLKFQNSKFESAVLRFETILFHLFRYALLISLSLFLCVSLSLTL